MIVNYFIQNYEYKNYGNLFLIVELDKIRMLKKKCTLIKEDWVGEVYN